MFGGPHIVDGSTIRMMPTWQTGQWIGSFACSTGLGVL
jgi:hypothetical protein